MAFHPDYATNGLFYVHYSDKNSTNGDSIFEEYKVSADANVADAASARLVLKVTQRANGALSTTTRVARSTSARTASCTSGWVTAAPATILSGSGQNLTILLAKILRIDPVGAARTRTAAPRAT